MWSLQALSLAAALLPVSSALELVQRDLPRVLSADIQRRSDVNPAEHDRRRMRKRQDSQTLSETLDNLGTLYFANATLGTPAQSLRLHLDTGSSDLWANAANSQFCNSRGDPCADAGVYNANDSSTYEFVNNLFNISYVDGSGAVGDYARDVLSFGGKDLTLQFGIGYESTSPEGILGIGYTINEVQVNRAGLDAYPNLPQALVNDGTIQNNAYSLWLNDLDANTGTILFGGVDTQKYVGTLATLPIIQEGNVYREFVIALTGMGQNGKNGSVFENQPLPVLLDSGSSLIYLPDEVAERLYKDYGASYDQSQALASISCDQANSDDTLEFVFSGPTISVPMNELVLPISVDRQGNPICVFGISKAGDSTSVLGDTFLRSAYVVYDLQNNEISLAPTNFNATESNILEITNSTGVPDATGVSGAVATGQANPGGAHNGLPGGGSSTAAGPIVTAMPWAGAAFAGLGLLAAL